MSESEIVSKFYGGMLPEPLELVCMLCMHVSCAHILSLATTSLSAFLTLSKCLTTYLVTTPALPH